MPKVLVVLFLCVPSMLFAHFEKQERALLGWFSSHSEEAGEQTIKVQTEAKGVVSNHRFDDVNWSTNVLQGLHFGVGGGPIIAGMVTVIAGVVTVGIWPAAVLATAGIARGAEKVAQKVDVRTQNEEFNTFTSQRNYDRYLASRLLLLIAAFRGSPSSSWAGDLDTIHKLFLEWATLVGVPLTDELKDTGIRVIYPTPDTNEETTTVKVISQTLALRINTEIHKYKPVQVK